MQRLTVLTDIHAKEVLNLNLHFSLYNRLVIHDICQIFIKSKYYKSSESK